MFSRVETAPEFKESMKRSEISPMLARTTMPTKSPRLETATVENVIEE